MISVQEILTRPLFNTARVVCGEKGLNRSIRWVHILDVPNFESLIHGNELILSTGAGIQNDNALHYVKGLIDQGATALCFELGTHIHSVPTSVVRYADEHQFPIIVFDKVVRFVDLTQDIHAFLIDRHHHQLLELDELSKSFQKLTLHKQGTLKLIKKIKEAIPYPLVYLPLQNEMPYCVPVKPKEDIQFLQQHVERDRDDEFESTYWTFNRETYYVQKIEAMGQTWGYLLIEHSDVTSFEKLVLDRASIALAQMILRRTYNEEKSLLQSNRWILDLMNDRSCNEREILTTIERRFPSVQTPFYYRICKVQHRHSVVENSDQYYMIQRIRSLFEQKAIPIFITILHDTIILFIIESKACNRDFYDFFLSKMSSTEALDTLHFSFSSRKTKLHHVKEASRESELVIQLHHTSFHTPCFYDELGIYQLLLTISNDELDRFIQQQLKGLYVDHVRNREELLATLNVYLQNNCSKQKTAERLNIARQTLYHRLSKIEHLLGCKLNEDCFQRLSIEVALCAYELRS
ncbi:PucR family transcriptional regulator [Geomicrobium sp. JCM 19038]|uniref:PucR family transcriptional regulator n=1 Tax=Geomicrobium sp. JCM 19038 TaxID=1460635 RepID=UPI00045F3C09|nr:PucR family transcriptional regulator [Geomicrobium sp. JCM 19038]GAK07170.1 putative regulatory protein [Geomicrobium sp. JCM 19038]